MQIKTKTFSTIVRDPIGYGLKTTHYDLTLFYTEFGILPGGTFVFFGRPTDEVLKALTGESLAMASPLQELYEFVMRNGGEQIFKDFLETVSNELNRMKLSYWLAPFISDELAYMFGDDFECDDRLTSQPLIIEYFTYFEKVSTRAALPTVNNSIKQTFKI